MHAYIHTYAHMHVSRKSDACLQIPVDVDEDFYVLSRYPFANCFFCGGAGPESVIDLRFPGKSERAYQTDERLTFRGKLRLNADDVYQMNYILDGAIEYTP